MTSHTRTWTERSRDRLADAFVAGRLHRERELCGAGGFQLARRR
jgi:hypothetical protein